MGHSHSKLPNLRIVLEDFASDFVTCSLLPDIAVNLQYSPMELCLVDTPSWSCTEQPDQAVRQATLWQAHLDFLQLD